MNKDVFCEALSAVVEPDYAAALNAPAHTFSPRFEKKMERLVQKQRTMVSHLPLVFASLACVVAVSFILNRFGILPNLIPTRGNTGGSYSTFIQKQVLMRDILDDDLLQQISTLLIADTEKGNYDQVPVPGDINYKPVRMYTIPLEGDALKNWLQVLYDQKALAYYDITNIEDESSIKYTRRIQLHYITQDGQRGIFGRLVEVEGEYAWFAISDVFIKDESVKHPAVRFYFEGDQIPEELADMLYQ